MPFQPSADHHVEDVHYSSYAALRSEMYLNSIRQPTRRNRINHNPIHITEAGEEKTIRMEKWDHIRAISN